MSLYNYVCDKCAHTLTAYHSMSEKLVDCEECGGKNTLIRIITMPLNLPEKKINKSKVGDLVKQHIEESREELREEKENLKSMEYKPE